MIRTAPRQIIGNITELFNHKPLERLAVDENRMNSEKISDTVIGMPGSATNMWTPPSVRRMFIAAKDRSFRTYVTDAPGAVDSCNIG